MKKDTNKSNLAKGNITLKNGFVIPYKEHQSRNGTLLTKWSEDLSKAQQEELKQLLREEETKLKLGRKRYAAMATSHSVWEEEWQDEQQIIKDNLKRFLDPNYKRLPAPRCVCCKKTIEEVGGGYRLVAQDYRGVRISKKPLENSLRVHDDFDLYVLYWDKFKPHDPSINERAKKDIEDGFHPWYCQICGQRACKLCESPLQLPMASDLLKDDGRITHFPIVPAGGGCVNSDCKNHFPKGDSK